MTRTQTSQEHPSVDILRRSQVDIDLRRRRVAVGGARTFPRTRALVHSKGAIAGPLRIVRKLLRGVQREA